VHLSSENGVIKIRVAYADQTIYYVDTFEHQGPLPVNPKELKPTSHNSFDREKLLTHKNAKSIP